MLTYVNTCYDIRSEAYPQLILKVKIQNTDPKAPVSLGDNIFILHQATKEDLFVLDLFHKKCPRTRMV